MARNLFAPLFKSNFKIIEFDEQKMNKLKISKIVSAIEKAIFDKSFSFFVKTINEEESFFILLYIKKIFYQSKY